MHYLYAVGGERDHGLKNGLLQFGGVVLSTVFIYAVMFVDNTIGIWPAFDLDYSTHTAIALVFIGIFYGVYTQIKCINDPLYGGICDFNDASKIPYASRHYDHHTICVMPIILLCQYKLSVIAKR